MTGRLPRSTDELVGLRAAHWGRESTGRQADRFGPEAQREQRDQAIRRYGLADTGIVWQVAHSGRTIASTAQWAEMLARAGRDYDILVVGYGPWRSRRSRASRPSTGGSSRSRRPPTRSGAGWCSRCRER